MVLNEWCFLCFLYESVERGEFRAVGCYAVQNARHWVLLGLYDNMLHIAFVSVVEIRQIIGIQKTINDKEERSTTIATYTNETANFPSKLSLALTMKEPFPPLKSCSTMRASLLVKDP